MTSSSMLEPPFRLSASEIASLWSEETGRSAIEIREDLETWLEDFGPEDTLSRDDKLLWLMGVHWVDRASLLTYCRNRDLEPPEFWFSETIARETSTGRRSDGLEPDHNAFSGSDLGSDRSIELSPTLASESLELVVREDLTPGGEGTDDIFDPRPAAVLELHRITKVRLVSRRLFIWGPALIVAFGVALVGWRYWHVDVENRVIASENVQKTVSQRIENGLETQTSKEMVREDQYRTDGAFLENQSRTGAGAAADKFLTSKMTQDELSIAPGKDRPAALTQAGALEGLAEAEAAWQAKSSESLAAAEAAWKRDEEARFAAARKTWAEEAKKLAGAAAGASVEAQLAAAQATWAVEEKSHLAAARKSWETEAKQRQATDREAQTASSGEDRYEKWTGETSSAISILTPKDRQSERKESQVRKPYASESEGLGEKSLEKAALPFSTASSPTAEKVAAEATVVTAASGEGEDVETAVFVEAEIALPPANPPQEEGIPDSRPEHLGPWHDAKETDLPDDILVYLTQKQLHVHDLYSGEMTGTLTYGTRAAIQSYQISYGIVPDGEVSKELLRHLTYKNLENLKQFEDEPRHMESTARSRSEMSISQTNQTLETTRGQAPDGTKGYSAKKHIVHSALESEHGTSTRGDMIRRTQEMLSTAGFQAGPSDGVLGQKTKSAIQSYQWAYDLPTDGLPTVGLLSHIEATIYLESALRQFSLGEFREASRNFSRLLKLRPDDADIYFNRGLAFKNSGNLAKASEDFQAAIEINPAHTRAHFNLGGVHYQQGQYGAALGSYGRFVQVSLQGR